MKVLTIERQMAASLRGRTFNAVAAWSPLHPFTITLTCGHEAWTLAREAVLDALAGDRLDRHMFEAAEVEIVRDVDDTNDHIEVTKYFKRLQPVSVWFAAAEWMQLLEDTLAVIPIGHEHGYIHWPAEFAWLKEASDR